MLLPSLARRPIAIVVSLLISLSATPTASSNGLGLTEDRLRLDRLPATATANFFPPPAALHREAKKPPAAIFHGVPAPSGCGPIVPGRATNGSGFTGSVKTLTLNVKTVKFIPTEGESERGPDFRIFAGATEFGAAWKKTARETQREYLSVKLDDPSFPAPIYASLVEAEDGEVHNLIWSRRNGD
jgi:uncharacterized protein (DUF736 family)